MVKKKNWKTQPIPNKREDLGYQNFFMNSDAIKILSGHIPEDMDDKWFIYSENGWVYFVRSWTGYHIFAIKLTETSNGVSKITASWVNNNPEQYNSPDREKDIQLINHLIKIYFGIEGHSDE